MALYRFYKLDSQNQISEPGRNVDCDNDAHAQGHGWELLAAEPVLSGVDIWLGARQVAHLEQRPRRPVR